MNHFLHENNVDLHVHTYGYEECISGHEYGPAVREYFLFHYVFTGRGLFQVGDNMYHLREGQGFLIYPKELTFYKADIVSPWSYGWIGITGLLAEKYLRDSGLSRENPIWRGEKDEFLESCLMGMNSGTALEPFNYPYITGYAYLFLARMMEKANRTHPPLPWANRQESYLRTAIGYMEQNYYKKLTVEEIARYVGLDRSYLGSIFRKHLNTTMQEFLICLRMEKACGLLKYDDIRIADVARSVGYQDQLQFSRVFREHIGVCPNGYRKAEAKNKF